MFAFGGDQQKLDLVVKLGELSVAIIAVTPLLDVSQPVAVMGRGAAE